MSAVSFALLLVLWGNLQQPLIGSTAVLPGGSWAFVATGAALIAVSLVAARGLGLDRTSLGLARSGALPGALLGAFAGAAIAAVDVGILRLAPEIIGRPVVYEPVLGLTRGDLAWHIALFLPLGAVLPEEIAFRGTLLGALLRRGARHAIGWSAVAFALWHAVVAMVTVANTTLGPPSSWFAPAVVATMAILVVGGAIMGALRVISGSLATPIAAHWAFNAVILVGLWSGRSQPPIL